MGRTKTGLETEGFEILIKVKDEVNTRKIETFSGGELTMIIIAIRLGIIELISEIKGMKTNFSIMDELFAFLDIENRNVACDLLNDLSKNFEQIIVMSHTEIGEILPNVIQFKRDGKFTKVII